MTQERADLIVLGLVALILVTLIASKCSIC